MVVDNYNMPVLTIGIPVYNAETTLSRLHVFVVSLLATSIQ